MTPLKLFVHKYNILYFDSTPGGGKCQEISQKECKKMEGKEKMNYAAEIRRLIETATEEQLRRLYWFILAFLAAGGEEK